MPTLSTKRTMARANTGMNKRLKTIERAVRQNKTELKFKEGSGTITNAGVPFDFTAQLTEGTGKDNRIGDTLNVKRVEVRMLGNAGLQRLRPVLYTPVDNTAAVPIPVGGNFNAFIDTNEHKIWSQDMNGDRLQIATATGTSNVPLPGKIQTLRKVFSIPMKVKYRDGETDPYHNPVKMQLVQQSATATATAPASDYGDFSYKIWYYDA